MLPLIFIFIICIPSTRYGFWYWFALSLCMITSWMNGSCSLIATATLSINDITTKPSCLFPSSKKQSISLFCYLTFVYLSVVDLCVYWSDNASLLWTVGPCSAYINFCYRTFSHCYFLNSFCSRSCVDICLILILFIQEVLTHLVGYYISWAKPSLTDSTLLLRMVLQCCLLRFLSNYNMTILSPKLAPESVIKIQSI